MKTTTAWAMGVIAALSLVAGPVIAHGDADHAKKAGPVHKTQKAWGIAGDPTAAQRTVEITMTDNMRFMPDRLAIKQGETVRIVVKNNGAVLHEFVLGTQAALHQHVALMARFPTMEHDEPAMAHVPPGNTGAIVWTVNRAGDFDFACLIACRAGHFQAGMAGTLKVQASITTSTTTTTTTTTTTINNNRS